MTDDKLTGLIGHLIGLTGQRTLEEIHALTSELSDEELIESEIVWHGNYRKLIRQHKHHRHKVTREARNNWLLFTAACRLREFADGGGDFKEKRITRLRQRHEEEKQAEAEEKQAEALRAPPIPKGTGIRAGDIL